jgi:DNA-directed RNA polymerase subunit beta
VIDAANEEKARVEEKAEERIDKILQPDELPPGVIQLVKVYLAEKRKISVGDKMAGRHGNKGIVARIVPEEDMPFLPDGRPVDIVLNPLGVPSRMNVGQILETHLGWAADPRLLREDAGLPGRERARDRAAAQAGGRDVGAGSARRCRRRRRPSREDGSARDPVRPPADQARHRNACTCCRRMRRWSSLGGEAGCRSRRGHLSPRTSTSSPARRRSSPSARCRRCEHQIAFHQTLADDEEADRTKAARRVKDAGEARRRTAADAAQRAPELPALARMLGRKSEADVDAAADELMRHAGLTPAARCGCATAAAASSSPATVTVGEIYMLKLSHLVDDKIHARSIGPYSLVTQQPLAGKAQFGGQRFGEMEVWALEAYGAAHTLQEMLTVKSDDVNGRSRVYEAIVKGQNLPEPGIPESFNVLVKELQALGISRWAPSARHRRRGGVA